MNNVDIFSQSAAFRFVGVVTVGITKIPMVGFGYPSHVGLSSENQRGLVEHVRSHPCATVIIEHPDDRTDHIEWRIFQCEMDKIGVSQPAFRLFLDLPINPEQDRESSLLFARTAREEKGFLVAVTVEDRTILCFYDLHEVEWNSETKIINSISGSLTRCVEGKAVPLLRTIETLRSQVAPQRKIQIEDEELGIIYEALFRDALKQSSGDPG